MATRLVGSWTRSGSEHACECPFGSSGACELAQASAVAPVSRSKSSSLGLVVTDVVQLAHAVGQHIVKVRSERLDASRKADRSLVTRADREADQQLRERLVRLSPAAWLSEETADDEGRLRRERVWIVDPLDGTKEFVEGLPEYAIAIALVEHCEPVLAVVHNPATMDTYWATRGEGAFRNGQAIQVRESGTLLASRSELTSGEFVPFATSWEVEPVGSIAYKLALVASGSGGATLSRGPKHEWDVCAGALIVSEAGGTVSDAFREPLRFNQGFPKVRGILAGAPDAYQRALKQIVLTGPSRRMSEVMRAANGSGAVFDERQ